MAELGLDGKLRRAVELLYSWQHERGTSFTCDLYRLMRRADPMNRRRLAAAFPLENEALEMWEKTPHTDLRAWFESWLGTLPKEKGPHADDPDVPRRSSLEPS